MLFTTNVVPIVNLAFTGLSLPTSGAVDFSDIIHSFDHDKSNSTSQLIKSKARNFRKFLKYVNGTTKSGYNLLFSVGALPIDFVLYSIDLILVVLLLIFSLLVASFSVAASLTSSLKYFHRLLDFLNNFHYILTNYISA